MSSEKPKVRTIEYAELSAREKELTRVSETDGEMNKLSEELLENYTLLKDILREKNCDGRLTLSGPFESVNQSLERYYVVGHRILARAGEQTDRNKRCYETIQDFYALHGKFRNTHEADLTKLLAICEKQDRALGLWEGMNEYHKHLIEALVELCRKQAETIENLKSHVKPAFKGISTINETNGPQNQKMNIYGR